MQGFATQHRSGLAVSIIGHLGLVALLAANLDIFPRTPLTRMAIEATVVTDVPPTATPPPEPEPQPEPAPEPEPLPPPEPDPAEEAEKERQRLEQERQAEAQRVERERQAEEQRRKEAEAARLAEEKRKAEEARKAEAERQARERAERERQEAERRAREEAERKARERRQAELLASMAAEEELLAARQSGELSRYLALIQQKVERNWSPPASARPGLECEVAVVQLPSGEVVDARTVRCNGDEAVKRSVENAVRRASPLPLPDNRALFERNLRFVFKPQQ